MSYWLREIKNTLSWSRELGSDMVRSNHLGYPLFLAIFLALVGGCLLFLVDPNIHTPIDGVWSAWVTMTHVGFGDVVPTSFLGRVLAALLILFGLALFSLFTALFSATLIERHRQNPFLTAREDTGREDRILAELTRLHQRLDDLEARLSGAESTSSTVQSRAR